MGTAEPALAPAGPALSPPALSAVAATAYAQLRTGWGRSEAYADFAVTDPGVRVRGL